MPERDEWHAGASMPLQRLDKWLWFARVAKSRTLAAQLIQDGRVRINRTRAAKPSQVVRPGDVLTIAVHGKLHVLKVVAPGLRRGPPAEARTLYEAIPFAGGASTGAGAEGLGGQAPKGSRPTKRDRRAIDRFTKQD